MLLNPSAKALERLAGALQITDHATGLLTKWKPNTEQTRLWEEGSKYRLNYALKPRQIGISTSECLKDLAFVCSNAAAGTPVDCWIVFDTEAKGLSKLELCQNFAKQLHRDCIRRDNQLLFPTAGTDTYSKISAMTAGGKRTGAGLSCHRLHMSELPAWQDAAGAFTAIMSCLNRAGHGVIETTILLGQEISKRLWTSSPSNGWNSVFFSVEEHLEYRRPKELFEPNHPELPEEKLRNIGFQNIETMAFIQYAYKNLVDEDFLALGREYPVNAAQCFAAAEGRWIRNTPPTVPHTGHKVGEHTLRIFIPPEETSGQCVIGLDTAGGLGQDRSAIAVLDRKTRKLCASFVDEWITIEKLIAVAIEAQKLYTRHEKNEYPTMQDPPPKEPLLIIEANGIGHASIQQYMSQYGGNFRKLTQSEGTTYACMLQSKIWVERGVIVGPWELVEEADQCHTENQKFKGRKDLLVSIGMALQNINEIPFQERKDPEPKNVFRPQLKSASRWSSY